MYRLNMLMFVSLCVFYGIKRKGRGKGWVIVTRLCACLLETAAAHLIACLVWMMGHLILTHSTQLYPLTRALEERQRERVRASEREHMVRGASINRFSQLWSRRLSSSFNGQCFRPEKCKTVTQVRHSWRLKPKNGLGALSRTTLGSSSPTSARRSVTSPS